MQAADECLSLATSKCSFHFLFGFYSNRTSTVGRILLLDNKSCIGSRKIRDICFKIIIVTKEVLLLVRG